jgi:hypothetical protein
VASETGLDTAPEMPAQVATGVLKAWAVRVADSAELAAEVVAAAPVVAEVAAAARVPVAEVVGAVAAAVVAGSEVRFERRLRPARFCRSVLLRV